MVAGQDLLPPRHGWTVEGAGALLDSTAVAGASLLSIDSGPGWWISHATPYGVPGLSCSGAAIAIRQGRSGVAVEWRQLSGDGLQHRSIHFALATQLPRSTNTGQVPAPSGYSETHVVSGLTFLSLGGAGARSLRWNRYRIGVVRLFRGTWSAAAEVRGTIDKPVDRERRQTRLGCAVACSDGPVTLRIGGVRYLGGLKKQRKPLEPSISINWKYGGVRFSVGGWGAPVAPAAGIDLTIGGITWCVEGRWVAGPGLYLLWSIRASEGRER